MGRKDEKPLFPLNVLGDFAGGGMLCALGIKMCTINLLGEVCCWHCLRERGLEKARLLMQQW
jgi:hypothetical protein